MTQMKLSLNVVRLDGYIAWTERLVVFYFWMTVKNFRWSRHPVSLLGGLRPAHVCMVLFFPVIEIQYLALACKKKRNPTEEISKWKQRGVSKTLRRYTANPSTPLQKKTSSSANPTVDQPPPQQNPNQTKTDYVSDI